MMAQFPYRLKSWDYLSALCQCIKEPGEANAPIAAAVTIGWRCLPTVLPELAQWVRMLADV